MLERDSVLRLVADELRRLLALQDRRPEITGHSEISMLGVDSLMLAELLVFLETELGVDPFQETSITHVSTVAELADHYADALASTFATADDRGTYGTPAT